MLQALGVGEWVCTSSLNDEASLRATKDDVACTQIQEMRTAGSRYPGDNEAHLQQSRDL